MAGSTQNEDPKGTEDAQAGSRTALWPEMLTSTILPLASLVLPRMSSIWTISPLVTRRTTPSIRLSFSPFM